MNVLIAGGTGFIGSHFIKRLVNEGCDIYVLTRNPNHYENTKKINYINYEQAILNLPIIHAVINLAGESIFGYWSKQKKARILSSRIETTTQLIDMMKQMEIKPEVFISGSAIGYYGISDDAIFTEKTTIPGDDFLANVTAEWEASAKAAEKLGIRTVYTRFGLVLDGKAGSLPLMNLPFKFFIGGKIGNGQQWMSWIHIEDCIELLYFSLINQKITGPINITAPYPERNQAFTKKLGQTNKKPTLITTPAFIFKLAFADMHQLITKGQYVLPEKAEKFKFTFKYPHLEDALTAIYQ